MEANAKGKMKRQPGWWSIAYPPVAAEFSGRPDLRPAKYLDRRNKKCQSCRLSTDQLHGSLSGTQCVQRGPAA